MKRALFSILVAFSVVQTAAGQSFVPGQSYFDDSSYVEYLAGELPVIFIAPHGGLESPGWIPDRNCSGCVYGNDLNTQELARAIYQSVYDETGCYPHLIINHLHRRKMDGNRDIVEAADGNPIAEQAWTDFHGFIELADSNVMANYGQGIVFDLHGHGHSIQRLELGYLISKTNLGLPDVTLSDTSYANSSSINFLASISAQAFSDLLRGPSAFGTFLANRGYPSVPSQQDPAPGSNDPYFSGGYNTQRYGSRDSGVIDAIQIEHNMDGVRDSDSSRQRYADSLAVALDEFIRLHYFENYRCSYNIGIADHPGVEKSVTIYPNPTRGDFTVRFTDEKERIRQLVLFDQMGKQVWSKQFSSPQNAVQIQVDLSKGIYHLQAISEEYSSSDARLLLLK